MATVVDCLFVGLGGALGAICRYLLGLIPIKTQSGFPVVTLSINLIGAFCIGLIIALSEKYTGFDSRLLLFLKVGLCGGFTTFSTFSHETAMLFQSGKTMLAVIYAVMSTVVCVAAVFGAQRLVK